MRTDDLRPSDNVEDECEANRREVAVPPDDTRREAQRL